MQDQSLVPTSLERERSKPIELAGSWLPDPIQ